MDEQPDDLVDEEDDDEEDLRRLLLPRMMRGWRGFQLFSFERRCLLHYHPLLISFFWRTSGWMTWRGWRKGRNLLGGAFCRGGQSHREDPLYERF